MHVLLGHLCAFLVRWSILSTMSVVYNFAVDFGDNAGDLCGSVRLELTWAISLLPLPFCEGRAVKQYMLRTPPEEKLETSEAMESATRGGRGSLRARSAGSASAGRP